jgi:hypothetical protein
MRLITGRRGVLRAFALTMATSALGVVSAAAKPSAALRSLLDPPITIQSFDLFQSTRSRVS